MDATDGVVAALERESWRPVAIFLTHGHICLLYTSDAADE